MCGEFQPRMPQFIEARAVDTIQDCDSTICRCRPSLFSSAHVDPSILHTAKCTLMVKKKQKTPNPTTLSASLSLSALLVPLYFRNCSHMSDGRGGGKPSCSNAHLEKQHHYLQLTLNFGEGAIVQGERVSGGGRGWKEIESLKRKKRDSRG